MSIEQTTIDDLKATIRRLQEECTEKSNIIVAMGERIAKLENYKKSKQASYEALQKRCNNLEWECRGLLNKEQQ